MRARRRRYHHVIQMRLNRSKAPRSLFFLTWTTMVKGDRKNRRGERTLVLPFRTMRLHDPLLQTSSQRLDVAFVVDETRFPKGSVEAQTVQSQTLFSRAPGLAFRAGLEATLRGSERVRILGADHLYERRVGDAFGQLLKIRRGDRRSLTRPRVVATGCCAPCRVQRCACRRDGMHGGLANRRSRSRGKADAQFEGSAFRKTANLKAYVHGVVGQEWQRPIVVRKATKQGKGHRMEAPSEVDTDAACGRSSLRKVSTRPAVSGRMHVGCAYHASIRPSCTWQRRQGVSSRGIRSGTSHPRLATTDCTSMAQTRCTVRPRCLPCSVLAVFCSRFLRDVPALSLLRRADRRT